MADIINLNKYRKARKQTEKSAQAARNRARHGRTRTDKERDLEENARSARKLDESRLDRGDDEQDPA